MRIIQNFLNKIQKFNRNKIMNSKTKKIMLINKEKQVVEGENENKFEKSEQL